MAPDLRMLFVIIGQMVISSFELDLIGLRVTKFKLFLDVYACYKAAADYLNILDIRLVWKIKNKMISFG